MRSPIYLDHNASTPLLPRVRGVLLRALDEGFGNPSADHAYGKQARAFVDRAREQVAALLGCDPSEILFTASGTESNNLALRGWAEPPRAIVTTAVEHPATVEPASILARGGAAVIAAPVGASGAVDPAAFAEALARAPSGGPIVASVMLAQNETGVVQPVAEIARIARDRGAIVHTDAAQAVGKIPVDVRALGVDLLSVAGHKLYAPKGVGALYVRRGVPIQPLLRGAGHERGLRPGTENVSGIAALGEACAIAAEDLELEAARQRALRDRLGAILGEGGFVIHGEGAERLPNTLNGRFPGVRGDALIARVPEVAFTTGSACHAGEVCASKILLAMGIPAADAIGAVRLSLGRLTTEEAIDRAGALLLAAARGGSARS
jgi:cysteine desulfurase